MVVGSIVYKACIQLAISLGLPANLLASVASGTPAVEIDAPSAEAASARTVTAPVSGNLLSWAVEEGAQVAVGDLIATMEAMKMETQVVSTFAGRVRRLVKAGTFCDADTPLAEIPA